MRGIVDCVVELERIRRRESSGELQEAIQRRAAEKCAELWPDGIEIGPEIEAAIAGLIAAVEGDIASCIS